MHKYDMNFREFVKLYEGGGLFQNPGQPESPDVFRGPSTNKDLYLHKFTGSGGSVSPIRGAMPGGISASPAMPAMPMGQQPPKRMKKMPKN